MASISSFINKIRTAIYGKDVRSSIADGIKAINDELESTTERQHDLEQTFENLIIDAGNNNSEVVAGRYDNVTNENFNTIGARIDSHSSRLEEKTTQINSINAVKADKTYVDTKISTIGNASPKGTYATLTALQTAYPTGTTGIYVVTANGHWYYWNGSAWTDGGVYQGTSIADDSVTFKMLKTSDIQAVNNLNPDNLFSNPLLTSADGQWSFGSAAYDDSVKIDGFKTVRIIRTEGSSSTLAYQSRILSNNTKYFLSGHFKTLSNLTCRISVLGYKNNVYVSTNGEKSATFNGDGYIELEFTTDASKYDEYRIAYQLAGIGTAYFAKPLLLLSTNTNRTFYSTDGVRNLSEDTINIKQNLTFTRFNPNNINPDKGGPEAWEGVDTGYASYSDELIDNFKTLKIRLSTDQVVNPYKVCFPPVTPYQGKISIRMKLKIVADNPGVSYPLTVTGMILSYPQADNVSGTAVNEIKDYIINKDGVYDIEVTQDISVCYRIHAAIRVRTKEVNFYVNQLTVTLSDKPQPNNVSNLFDELLKTTPEKEEILTLLNPLYNKKVLWNGDSIGQAIYGNGGYASQISQRNSMTSINYCIGGGTIGAETYTTDGVTPRHWISRDVVNMDNESDYIIFEGGINDYSLRVPMGSITPNYTSTLDDTTFCGGLESLFKQAQLKWPGCKIGFIIIHKIAGTYYPYGSTTDDRFEKYRDNIIAICKKWSVPYLDLFDMSGLNTNIPEIKSAYFHLGDGTHPNELGYLKYYTPKIEAWMKTI